VVRKELVVIVKAGDEFSLRTFDRIVARSACATLSWPLKDSKLVVVQVWTERPNGLWVRSVDYDQDLEVRIVLGKGALERASEKLGTTASRNEKRDERPHALQSASH